MFPTPMMLRSQIANLCQTNPLAQRAWAAAQQMTRGNNNEKRVEIVKNLAKERGISYEQLQEIAKQYGINL